MSQTCPAKAVVVIRDKEVMEETAVVIALEMAEGILLLNIEKSCLPSLQSAFAI